jgi:hypothetical protein
MSDEQSTGPSLAELVAKGSARILAGEKLTIEEHRELLAAYRARRAGIMNEPTRRAKAARVAPTMSLDDLMQDFS